MQRPAKPAVRAYLVGHALALGAFWFVPVGGWAHCLLQAIVSSLSTVFLVVGVRRQRPEAAVAWYLIAAGVFVNAWGVVVDLLARRFFGARTSPNPADAFWAALFPAAVVG